MACSVHRPKVLSKFQEVFGAVINTRSMVEKHNKVLKRKLRDLNISLKKAKDSKDKVKLRNDIKNVKVEIIKSDNELAQAGLKFKALTTIRDLMVDQVDDIMTSAHGTLEIPVMMKALKHLLGQRFGAFHHFSDLSAEDLVSIGNDLIDIFQKQNISAGKQNASLKARFFRIYKAGELSWWQDQVMDPIMALLEADKTGFGIRFVQATKDFLSKSA